jgi:serine/threonine-protein kinase
MIGDRYRLGRRIGRGGMATVYAGEDLQLGRPVAIKVMRADLSEDVQFVRRFDAEARRAASVSHPNVVAVYDTGTEPQPYIVMQLVEGGDLAALVRREGRVAPEHGARLVADAADAVAAAHASGLVHRDVKPGNILIGDDGRAMVADFGIARATGEESLTRTGAALGSVDYFSPEQARGERAGAPSDVYSLGVVLYELLTGRRPFTGETPYAVATARLGRPAPDPRIDGPGLPDELAAIARRAMAEAPSDRFATAAELRDALRAWLQARDDERVRDQAAAGVAAPHRVPSPGGRASRDGTRVEAVRAGDERPRPPDPRALRSSAAGRRPSPTPRRAAAAAALAVLAGIALLAGGWMWETLRGGTDGLPGVVVGSPGGALIEELASSSALPTERAMATTSPRAAPSATPAATPAPSSAPPAATPAVPAATPAPTVVVAAATEPDDAVAAFYGYVEAKRFDEAYALWSERMKADYPRGPNLDERFADTADISFTELRVASRSASAATVQANFRETYRSGAARDFIGYWRIVLVDGRWLLDEPTY